MRLRSIVWLLGIPAFLALLPPPTAGQQPVSKIWFENRPMSTALRLNNLPDCCLADEAEYQAELEEALSRIPSTPCPIDDGLEGSLGDLLFTPFQEIDNNANQTCDNRVVLRFANGGQMLLGFTDWWVTGGQSCGANSFSHVDADVTLNRKFDWVKEPGTPFCPDSTEHYSLLHTALHELGHAIGMEHSPDPTQLMFGGGAPCDFRRGTFQQGDLDQFAFAYDCTGDCDFDCAVDDDCAGAGEICCDSFCILPACDSDADCDDSDACSIDTCTGAGTCSVACVNDYPDCGLEDGCCGSACDAANDGDCGTGAPEGTPFLELADTEKRRIEWTDLPDATAYDLVRGDLVILRGSSGDFTQATELCLADDRHPTFFNDDQVPAIGGGFWYAVRGVNDAGNGTYDSLSNNQTDDRDQEIEDSAFACP